VEREKLELLFETFFDITSLVRMERGESALYSRVLDCCRDVLRADVVMLLRLRNGRLERYAKRGSGAALHRSEIRGTQPLLEWLDREAAPFMGPAGEWYRPFTDPIFTRSSGSILCAPLVAKESQLGLLVALRENVPGQFSQEDLRTITVLANQTAIALENAELYERLRREAVIDGLTGILNYRSFMRNLRSEMRRARRYGLHFAFVMADVDRLKVYNERFGHLAGSQVLAQVARFLVGSCRTTDIVGKYGGDEFALILPQTGAEGARALCERMRQAIAVHAFKHVQAGDVTCSFGVALYPADAEDIYGLIRRADGILFMAKRAGKNTVRTTSDPDVEEAAGPGEPEEQETRSRAPHATRS
jgi:diguanylate cyclase (GGDEF)-like protein